MLITRETVTSASGLTHQSADQLLAGEYLTGSFVIREVPLMLTGSESIKSPNRATLHYMKLQVEGIESLSPESIEVDVSAIAGGGHIRIDELPMPPCCEVIGVWFANPVVSIGPQK